MRCDVTDVATPEIVREAFRRGGIKVGAGVGVQDGDGDDDESALSEASGRRVLVTENRSSQPLATLSCTHTAGFGERDRLSRHAVAAVAVRSTPIVQGRHLTADLNPHANYEELRFISRYTWTCISRVSFQCFRIIGTREDRLKRYSRICTNLLMSGDGLGKTINVFD